MTALDHALVAVFAVGFPLVSTPLYARRRAQLLRARATILGAVFAGLYLFSEALWPAMILHAAIDLTSGEAGAAVFSSEAPTAA